jgi:hypothetical protein
MDSNEPHLAPNEEMRPIRWTERPTGALVAAGSLSGLLLPPPLLVKDAATRNKVHGEEETAMETGS